jgi:PBSX family phage terminase large subunit
LIEVPPNAEPYYPRGAAWDLFYKYDLKDFDEVLLDGPSGTGKTLAALMWIYNAGMEYPGANILIARKTRESMTKSCLRTFETQILSIDAPEVMEGRDRNQRDHYKLPNGTRYEICGITDVERIKSAEYDIIYVNEVTELLKKDYEYLTTRLRKSVRGASVCPYKLLITDCNPSYPQHYIHTRFDPKHKNYKAIPARRLRLLSKHKDNPMLWDNVANCWTDDEHGGGADYMRKLHSMTGADKRRMCDGDWVGEEGLVYNEFDELYHIIKRADVPPVLYTVGVVDWGITNAGVLQVWGVDEEERGYMLEEVHAYDKGIDWWAEQALKLYGRFRPRLFLCDPARRDMRELFNNRLGTRYGQPVSRICIPANNEHDAGIAQVKSALTREQHARNCPSSCQRNDPNDRHGKARLYLVEDALEKKGESFSIDDQGNERERSRNTAEEFLSLPWKKTKDGQEVKEEWDNAVPHDGLDCVRYFAMYNERKSTSTRRTKTRNPFAPGTPGFIMWQEGRRQFGGRAVG